MSNYKKHKLNEDQIYKMAKQFYDDCNLKSVMSFDKYFNMIYPQIQAYVDLDNHQLRKAMLKSKQTMLDRTERGINKLKKQHDTRKKSF